MMFNAKKHSGDAGYQIVIRYDVEKDIHFITGYIMTKEDNNRIRMDKDGKTIPKETMAEVVEFIANSD